MTPNEFLELIGLGLASGFPGRKDFKPTCPKFRAIYVCHFMV